MTYATDMLDMRPAFAIDNVANHLHADTVLAGKRMPVVLPRLEVRPNLKHRSLRQLGLGILFAPQFIRVPSGPTRRASRIAAFAERVLMVVFVGAHEQVSGVAAGRVITAVTDEKTGQDRAVGKLKGHSVGEVVATFEADVAVTLRAVATHCPRPAGIGTAALIDSLPEILGKGWGILDTHFLNLLHRFGGVMPRGVSAPPRFSMPNYSTDFRVRVDDGSAGYSVSVVAADGESIN